MTFKYQYVFPISIPFATAAMASGLEGATFFSPPFILALKLSPEVAFGTVLTTEVFGFASRFFAYARNKLIDHRLGLNPLLVTVPLALVGTWGSGQIQPVYLKPSRKNTVAKKPKRRWSRLMAKRFATQSPTDGMMLSRIGMLFMCMVSTALGEMNTVFSTVMFTVPDVIIPGQIGSPRPAASRNAPSRLDCQFSLSWLYHSRWSRSSLRGGVCHDFKR
jgi:uncharacterized protein